MAKKATAKAAPKKSEAKVDTSKGVAADIDVEKTIATGKPKAKESTKENSEGDYPSDRANPEVRDDGSGQVGPNPDIHSGHKPSGSSENDPTGQIVK